MTSWNHEWADGKETQRISNIRIIMNKLSNTKIDNAKRTIARGDQIQKAHREQWIENTKHRTMLLTAFGDVSKAQNSAYVNNYPIRMFEHR